MVLVYYYYYFLLFFYFLFFLNPILFCLFEFFVFGRIVACSLVFVIEFFFFFLLCFRVSFISYSFDHYIYIDLMENFTLGEGVERKEEEEEEVGIQF